MKNPAFKLFCAAFASVLLTVFGSAAAQASRPNIVFILADDLGFTDTAPYGSEINTPTISALAAQGLRFSNYHTAGSCAPSRAMLLTGVDSHRAGVPNIPEMLPPEQTQHPNYRGVLSRNVVTIATLLQDQGYHTYIAGKWHLGMTPDLLPSARGFERSFIMADSGADNWEQKPYLPIYEQANWFADGKRTTLPDDFYSSRFLIDKTIEFIDSNASDGKPFFAYVPFQAVHLPVQAPQEFIDRYMDTYNGGWDELRRQRYLKAVELGLVPKNSAMVDMQTTADWDALTPAQKKYQAKRMAVYAAMVEAMDFHIGRLISHLKDIGEYENTIFVFTSDNGAEPSGPVHPDTTVTRFALGRQGYKNDYETLGLKGSFNSIGPSFASAAASPLSYYKFYSGEGGMRVPLIIAGERLPSQSVMTSAFTFATDIAPTILELAGTAAPEPRFGELRYGGRKIEPITGRSLLPLIKGEQNRIYDPDEPIGYELGGNSALFQGDYKIVLNRGPVGDGKWYLYNIVEDPSETRDLSKREPKRFQDMLNAYVRYTKDNGVLPVPKGFNAQQQVALNGLRERAGPAILIGILLVLTLLPFVLYARARRKGQSE
ncbi:arylsulfatase [Sphingorhabdus sp. Alg239-R122]|uniref:arylsulfatase n=1 Tax=Sphingorhabdus sp. Alg239-R122 TaxID=2305989 RepID=UPI0013D95B04|nr:arylsulfatase [Sphingorhabdus sp. Alg239-R122]